MRQKWKKCRLMKSKSNLGRHMDCLWKKIMWNFKCSYEEIIYLYYKMAPRHVQRHFKYLIRHMFKVSLLYNLPSKISVLSQVAMKSAVIKCCDAWEQFIALHYIKWVNSQVKPHVETIIPILELLKLSHGEFL